VAEFESKIAKKEEEFRRADNERMRRFFNARYDDIPAAMAGPSPASRMDQENNPFSGNNNR